MRVVQVVNVRWFNATAWYGVELARLARDAGHQSLVVGLAGSAPLARAQALGLATRALPLNSKNPLAYPALFAAMARLLDDFKPDVVNCHRGEAFFLWALLRLYKPFALVRTRGDQRLPKNTWLNRWLHSRMADAVIATNTRMQQHFIRSMGLEPQRTHCILGGVDTSRFVFNPAARERVRAQLGYGPQHTVLGLLGRFDHVKGQRECLESLALLKQQGHTHVRLLLIGFSTAVDEAEVRAWIRELGLEAETHISGLVDDVPAYISATDIGLVTSLASETIARAALEIMACNRPLLSTAVGVMPDLLPPEALCQPGSAAALAALVHKALGDPDWLEIVQSLCAERLRFLTSDFFCNETLAVYRQARHTFAHPQGA